MKKLLFILFITPVCIFGQDVPLTEKKVTTESMENKDRKLKEKADDKVRKKTTKLTKKFNRSLAMYPKNQIGYIMNPKACPIGLNFYRFFKKTPYVGWYVDYRTNPELLTENYWKDRSFIESLGMTKVGTQNTANGYSVINYGLAARLAPRLVGSKYTAWILYFGLGNSIEQLYDEYTTNYTNVSNTTDYVRNGGNTLTNFNFGILRQTNSVISWQVGFDSNVPGINFGMGLTWD